ncbi:MAG: AsmA family protein [Proteobacteria bacterium]|nr:AsmA family protein [Pseudomonadota bacterium]
MNPTVKQSLQWTGIGIGSVVLILVLVLAFMDWNWFKHPIERIVSADTGRTVTIAGNLNVHIWSWTPTVVVNGLTLGNPPWESNRPMARIERLEIHLKLLPLLKGDVILPRVALFKPDVYLHQDEAGRANWTFENKAPTKEPASKPTKLPAMRDLLIQDGKLQIVDEMRKLKVDGTIQAHEQKSQADPTPFRIEGHGTINDQPFELHVAGGPLVNLDPEHPYPYDLDITAGDIKVASKGRVLKPFDLSGMEADVALSGKDLAEGYYLTQLALPNTAPFDLRAHIARNGLRFTVTDIAGKVGESDLHGKLDIDATRKRPSMTGELVSDQLRMKDLAQSLGGKTPKGGNSLDAKAEQAAAAKQAAEPAKAPNPNALLFPDAHLQLARVRAMDADVHFRAKSIEAGTVPFKKVAFRVKLDDGVLALDPFAFEMPQGRLSGNAKIDARMDVPKVHIDARIKDIQLDQLKGKAPDAQPPLSGVMQARMVINGSGDSVHRVMSDANGTFTVILPNGEVRSAFAELTGINVAKGLGLLLTKADDKAPIRCGVAQFNIRDGIMSAQNITFDTQNVVIKGKGDIDLGPESLNLEIKGEPKKFRFTRLRSPIEVKGHLKKPSVGLNVGDTAKQGAVAAALGTLVTPLAAVLAFVDPGLAKDQNCAQMIAEADSKGPKAPKSDFESPNRASTRSKTATAPRSDPTLR